MNTRRGLVNVLFCVLLATTATVAFAQGGPPPGTPGQGGPPQEVVDMLMERGWKQVIPSVFQRPTEDGLNNETIAFGADGLFWLLRVMEAQLQALEARRTDIPSPDLEEAIASHVALMDYNRALMEEERAQQKRGLYSSSQIDQLILTLEGGVPTKGGVVCDTSVHRQADAFPGANGPEAQAQANFTDTCDQFGDPYCDAFAEGWVGTVYSSAVQTDDPPGATGGASCSVAVAVSGTSSCYSFALGQVTLRDSSFSSITMQVSDMNYSCLSLKVSITGPTSLWVGAYTCRTATWTAVGSDGTPPVLAYEWRYNGAVVGTGSSYSRTYCNSNPSCWVNKIFLDTVSVTVTDSAGDQASTSQGMSVTYGADGLCCEPCFCAATYEQPVQQVAPCPVVE